MPKEAPPPHFPGAQLDTVRIGRQRRFGRIYYSKHPDPLGFGKPPSRFSDPRRRVAASRYGVLYLGSTLKGCFVEAILRDERNGNVGDWPIEEAELRQRRYATIAVASPLVVVDLTGDGPIRMGIPSDVVGARSQGLARSWSLALHEHPDQVDGILYPSRLNEERNLAIFDRAVSKLSVSAECDLLAAPGFASVLRDLKVALV